MLRAAACRVLVTRQAVQCLERRAELRVGYGRRAVVSSVTCGLRFGLLPEHLDELRVECREVLRRTRADNSAVLNNFLVDPRCAGVAEVGLQRRVRGDGASANGIRFNEQPGSVANRANRAASGDVVTNDRHCIFVHANFVSVARSARQDDCVVLGAR